MGHIRWMKRLLISWAPAALWAGVLFYLSDQSHLPGPSFLPLNDKAVHFVAYLVLGLTLAWAGRGWIKRRVRRWPEAGLIFIGILFAASDEWHQSFVPRRVPSMEDFGADVLGVVIGFLLARWLLSRCRGPAPPTAS